MSDDDSIESFGSSSNRYEALMIEPKKKKNHRTNHYQTARQKQPQTTTNRSKPPPSSSSFSSSFSTSFPTTTTSNVGIQQQQQQHQHQHQHQHESSMVVIKTQTATATATSESKEVSDDVLPTPSPEQHTIINAVQEGHCVTVRACAGSGKTTCMLQVAASLPSDRRVVIITYNRSLADECKMRIAKLQLEHRITCYTIHGLVSRFAGQICNDDQKLIQQVHKWDSDQNQKGYDDDNEGSGHTNYVSNSTNQGTTKPIPLDLVMLDEAQDLRPILVRALSHIFRLAPRRSSNASDGRGMQLCLVGDPKQLLYNFATFGTDKASSSFFLQPKRYWSQFTSNRKWMINLPLSISYRLTPNIASVCNLFWGTAMTGGNTSSPNIPVEYMVKYPYPNTYKFHDEDPEKLSSGFFANLIDQHGPENVLFLAQSIKSEKLPIRVHVNQLLKIKTDPCNPHSPQKYNFHIKENDRGFEGKADLTNKVRVWTFCGSKGCEADVVVVFGFDIFQRLHGLNQIGVALSRAKKRLILLHGCKYSQTGSKECIALPYYPVLGDSRAGLKKHIVRYGEQNQEELRLDIPAIIEQQTLTQPGGGGKENTKNSGQEVQKLRSKMAQNALHQLEVSRVVTVDSHRSDPNCDSLLPERTQAINQKQTTEVYVASDFNYFSASAEAKYLQYGTWTTIVAGHTDDAAAEGDGDAPIHNTGRIPYQTDVQFATTKEDVSALYGEAVTFMLQWELCKYVPNIETIVSDGILRLIPDAYYKEHHIRKQLQNMGAEPLTPKDDEILITEFLTEYNKGGGGGIKGVDLIKFMNIRLNLKKKRHYTNDNDNDNNGGGDDTKNNEIVFPVKVMERKKDDDDNQLDDFLPQIKEVYALPTKQPFQWIYLANAVMAFSNYHEKFRQIGTNPASYEAWVNSNAPLSGLERLKDIMKRISLSSSSSSLTSLASLSSSNNYYDTTSGRFERELCYDFTEGDCIKEDNNGRTIVGVGGICDWVNEDSSKKCYSAKQQEQYDVDLLEIKFVHALSNQNRLQVLVYCALYALELNTTDSEDKYGALYALGLNDNDNEDKDDADSNFRCRSECSGMLYNARTGEIEICSIQARNAKQFLLDISQFKYNGIEQHQKQPISTATTIIRPSLSKEVKNEWQSKKPPKKRRRHDNDSKSHYTDDGRDQYHHHSSFSSSGSTTARAQWPKRPKNKTSQNNAIYSAATNERLRAAKYSATTTNNNNYNNNTNNSIDLSSQAGTDDDPIILD